jgi:hypothetical protein
MSVVPDFQFNVRAQSGNRFMESCDALVVVFEE